MDRRYALRSTLSTPMLEILVLDSINGIARGSLFAIPFLLDVSCFELDGLYGLG